MNPKFVSFVEVTDVHHVLWCTCCGALVTRLYNFNCCCCFAFVHLENSFIKQAMVKNSQILEGLPSLKKPKPSKNHWLTQNDKPVCVISCFLPLAEDLVTTFTEEKDSKSPNIILTML